MRELWIEKVIKQAQEEGKLDPGKSQGKPIPGIDRPYDPAWWARNWIQAERAREQTAELASMVERELPRVLSREDPAAIRTGLVRLNAAIQEHNDKHGEDLPLLDVDRLVAERS